MRLKTLLLICALLLIPSCAPRKYTDAELCEQAATISEQVDAKNPFNGSPTQSWTHGERVAFFMRGMPQERETITSYVEGAK